MVKTMSKKVIALAEKVNALADFSKILTCKDINPHIESGKLVQDGKGLKFIIPSLAVEITLLSTLEESIQDGLKKAVSAYSASFAKSGKVPEAIRECVEVWKEGQYLDPAAKKRAAKVTSAGAGKAYKLPHARTLIEGALRDILGPEDGRTKKIESLSDELFVALIEAKGSEGYLLQAIERLNKEKAAALEKEKASLLAEFGDLGL